MGEQGPSDEQRPATPLRNVEPPGTADHLLDALRDRDRVRFRQEGEIARGGMGAILKVRDQSLQRDLAMKVILPERRDDDSGTPGPYVHRFLEEAQVTAQLDHPGVVPVHELGVDDDGQLFFTMKLVRGRTLAEIFELVRQQEDEWSQPRALQVFIRVCETLAFAHAKGVIHRDLKPANIMVGAFGEVYVMDWGLAKVLGGRAEPETAQEHSSAQATLVRTSRKPDSTGSGDSPMETLTGDVLGTPAYMPLEQALGHVESLDARSDVYAIGAMLYELLAGHCPYGEPSKQRKPHEILTAAVAGPPLALARAAKGVPEELIAICEKAMARDAADRYQTAAELGRELGRYSEGRVVRAHRTGAVVELRKWIVRNKALASAIGAMILLFLTGAVLNRALYRDAVQKGEIAERETYRAALAAAEAELREHEFMPARLRLEALPERLRGWEWRHLRSRAEPGFARYDIRSEVFESGSGRVVGIAPEGSVVAHDPRTDEREILLPPGSTRSSPLRTSWVSPGARYCVVLAGGEPGEYALYDLKEQRRVATLPEGAYPYEFRRGDGWFRFKHGGAVRYLSLATGEIVAKLPPKPDSAPLRIEDKSKVIDARSGELLTTLPRHSDYTAVPTRSDRVLDRRNRTLSVLDARTGKLVGEPIAHSGNLYRVAFSADGALLAAGSSDKRVFLIDLATGRLRETYYGTEVATVRLTFSEDSRYLLAGTRGGAVLYDIDAGLDPDRLRGHTSFVYPAIWSPDGRRIVSGGWDGYAGARGALRVWDALSGAPIAMMGGPKHIVRSARFLPDGSRLIVSGLGRGWTVETRDADTLKLVRSYGSGCTEVAVNPEGNRILAWQRSKPVRAHVYDAATGNVLAELEASGLALCFGRRQLVTTAEKKVILWDAHTFARGREISVRGTVSRIVFEPGEDRLLIAGTHVNLADASTGEILRTLPGNGSPVLAAAFSPDGTRFVTGTRNGGIHVWDAESYDELVNLRGHTSYVYSLEFSPDGESLVSSSGDGDVRIWDTRTAAERIRARHARAQVVQELKPKVDALFTELGNAKAVATHLRTHLTARPLEIALQLTLAESIRRRGE